MSNNDRIQEIRDRQKSATPGDWFVNPGEHFYSIISAQRKGRMQVIASEIAANDAMIIGHATSDVAYLLSEYDRLLAALTTMTESEDEWYVGRVSMKSFAQNALSHLKG